MKLEDASRSSKECRVYGVECRVSQLTHPQPRECCDYRCHAKYAWNAVDTILFLIFDYFV